MADPIWLAEYSGENVDALLALEKTHRTDSLVLVFEMAIQEKRARVGDQVLTDEEWTVLAVEALEREVNNGGYDQFFVNSSVEFAPRIVESLRRIQCPSVAEITADALAALHLPELTVSAIEQVIYSDNQDRTYALNECDRRFFEYPEPIAERLFAFIRKNKSRVRIP